MASLIMWVLISLLATLALSAAASSSSTTSPPPKSSVNCDSVVTDMMECLSYVSVGSNESRPDKECCQGVSTVVKLSPTCLCAALQEAIKMGFHIDLKRAARLPAACSIKVSVGDCGVTAPPPGVPGPAPSPKPTPSPPNRPTPTPAPPSPPKSTPTPPPPKTPTPRSPPPHSPVVPPTPAPVVPPTPAPAPPKETPPSPASPPESSPPPVVPTTPVGPPSLPPAPSPSPVESESSTARRLPISIMTAMIALVVAACSYLEL